MHFKGAMPTVTMTAGLFRLIDAIANITTHLSICFNALTVQTGAKHQTTAKRAFASRSTVDRTRAR